MMAGVTLGKIAAAALLAAAACNANRECVVDQQCESSEACRLQVQFCAGRDRVAVVVGGYCRDYGSVCSSNADCVPTETCRSDGVCHYDPTLCQNPPATCPAGCQLHAPYPCACLCPGTTCP